MCAFNARSMARLNMLRHIIILIFVLMCGVKSDKNSETAWRSIDDKEINNISEYCKNRICVLKCCRGGFGMGKNLTVSKTVINVCKPRNVTYNAMFHQFVDWNTSLSNDNISLNKPYFDFVVNEELTASMYKDRDRVGSIAVVLMNGSLRFPNVVFNMPNFCVDLFKLQHRYILGYGITHETDPNTLVKQLFAASGMLISAFFMLIVLFVYGVLPALQNIVGMVLMSYLVSLSATYILFGVQMIMMIDPEVNCHHSSIAVYMFALASFFWLNTMSFDLWWTLRGARKCRDVHRRGELVKFLWYSLYAWGMPALLTIIAVIIEQKDLIANEDYKPPFKSCQANKNSVRIYLYGPIGVMTIINVLLFCLTAYNIWQIKRSITNSTDSRSTTDNKNRFKIYGKLFVLMGVTWVIDLLPTQDLTLYIIVNSPNLFVGVIIFYILVCKKSIIRMLCKRFNFKSEYFNKLHSTKYSKTEITSSGKSCSLKNNKDEDQELSTYSTQCSKYSNSYD